ncbi:MAG: sigma-70 family RNA polymerase sigma factor [Deltaproteobacteria bacterium]|nr:sigma-70 family RNA polymerase sigma factor [Deltaproteobacteria bacterium]
MVELPTFESWVRERDGGPCLRDLYLACAIAAGDRAALIHFDRELAPAIETAARLAGADRATAADIRQQVSIEVVVGDGDGDGARPAIGQYRGRGDLRGWLRSIAVRAAWRQLRAVARTEQDSEAVEAVAGDPMSAQLRATYGAAISAAMRAGFASLPPRDRALLRLVHCDGLSADDLARMYGVHRATAARWAATARAALVAATRVRLRGDLGAELTSAMHLAGSEIRLGSEDLRSATPAIRRE